MSWRQVPAPTEEERRRLVYLLEHVGGREPVIWTRTTEVYVHTGFVLLLRFPPRNRREASRITMVMSQDRSGNITWWELKRTRDDIDLLIAEIKDLPQST